MVLLKSLIFTVQSLILQLYLQQSFLVLRSQGLNLTLVVLLRLIQCVFQPQKLR